MSNYAQFPNYIYSPATGYLYITQTNEKVLDDSEYGTGPKKFESAESAKKYLKENNMNGILGVRFTN